MFCESAFFRKRSNKDDSNKLIFSKVKLAIKREFNCSWFQITEILKKVDSVTITLLNSFYCLAQLLDTNGAFVVLA